MPTRQQMLDLVAAHAQLDEPMETAIWINQDDQREAWLVEVISSMAADEHPEQAVAFNAGRFFRYPLNWIGVNRGDLERAIRSTPELARAIANGEVLYNPAVGKELIALAREVTHGNLQAS